VRNITPKEVTPYGEVDSIQFATYLTKKANEKQVNTNITKIQKWLYICYGLYWAAENKQLLNERPKAWDYGPAFPKVYKAQKNHNDTLEPLITNTDVATFSVYDDLINSVLDTFGSWTASQLVNWTHEEGSAWDRQKQNAMYEALDDYNIKLDFRKILRHDQI